MEGDGDGDPLLEDQGHPHPLQLTSKQNSASAASASSGRKVMFRLDDEEPGASPEQQFANLKDDESRPLLDNTSPFSPNNDNADKCMTAEETIDREDINDADFDDQVLKTECSDDNVDLFLEELERIDALYEKIESEIQSLAGKEKKEVVEIERLLEAAAEAATSVGTGGLDKIVERDDEGGGEQAEDED